MMHKSAAGSCLCAAVSHPGHPGLILPWLAVLALLGSTLAVAFAGSTGWVGTWSTAPQLVETNNNPPAPGLTSNTLRQILRVSIGGDTLRMRFSNEFSSAPVTLQRVLIAASAGGGVIDPATERPLLFQGGNTVTIPPGLAATSDPFPFSLQPRMELAVTIHFGSTPSGLTGHPGSRTTSYLLAGDQTGRADFAGAVRTDHWYIIHTIDVQAPAPAAAVAVLGNSITDGRGSGTNKQNRWPDELARRLQENPETQHVAVLNQGIGGNCVLGTCLGPSALSRFNRDVLEQSGVRWLVILEGINDIGNGGSGVGERIIDAFSQMIRSAHSRGIFVYGATLLPMSGNSYYSPIHEAERQKLNQWIRHGGLFDGVIDFDLALRNPADTLSLLPEADTGDHLHPNETGHRLMGEAVDLSLFTGREPYVSKERSESRFHEPECATVGGNWRIGTDSQASGGVYVMVEAGIQSLSTAPAGSENWIQLPFAVDSSATFSLFARLNCPTADDDSYWIKMDDGGFQMFNGLGTNGWEWKKLGDYALTAGAHTLVIGYREDGAKLDKICLSNAGFAPTGVGEEAENSCTTTGAQAPAEIPTGCTLGQNYPNPLNPATLIRYQLPGRTSVRMEVWDAAGRRVSTLIDRVQESGEHTIRFDGSGLASGIYFYRLTTSTGFSQSRRMLLLR